MLETPEVVINPGSIQAEVECNKDLEITLQKREFSIVGDNVYVTTSSEAPQWLLDLINGTIANAIAEGTTDFDDLRENILNAIAAMDIAKNDYDSYVIKLEDAEGKLLAYVETLNATVADSVAEIVSVLVTKATPAEASALAVEAIQASINAGAIKSQLDTIKQTVATESSTRALQIDTLTSAITDENSGLAANATAVETLYTYVGIDGDLTPTGTGLLSTIEIIQKQNDGVIDTYAGTHYIKVCDANLDDGDLNQLLTNQYPYALWTPMEGSGVPTATTRVVYRDAVSSNEPIVTYTIYKDTATNLKYIYDANTSSWSAITDTEYNNYYETLRAAHVGDVYILYSIEEGVKVYNEACKFVKTAVDTTSPYNTDAEGYGWLRITDTDAQAAYMQALNAYDLADNKRRVFVSTPVLPYDEGDLWVDSSGTYKVVKIYKNGSWVVADEQTAQFANEVYTPTVTTLKNQVDGKIEYYFYNNYTEVSGAISESTALNIIDNAWSTTALKEAANGNVVYFKDTDNGYWYSSTTSNWEALEDTSMLSALRKAEQAKSSADAKVTAYSVKFELQATATTPLGSYVEGNYIIIYRSSATNDTGSVYQKLFYKNSTSIVEHTSNLKVGDIAVGSRAYIKPGTSTAVATEVVYKWTGTAWAELDGRITAISEWGIALENFLETGTTTGTTIDSSSNVYSTLRSEADSDRLNTESKFGYNSNLIVNGKAYTTGFGLVSTGTQTGNWTDPVNGINYPTFNSEFWIKADKFRLSDSYGSVPVFTIDAPSRSAVFNGKVIFNGFPSTLESAVQNYVEQVSVGDKNINITDNLIPTTSLLADVSNAGYQFIGNPVKSSAAGIDSYNEPQIVLDSDDEVYSPYVDEISAAYYYRFGLKTTGTNINDFKICVINTSNTVTYTTPVITDMAGNALTLTSNTWYIIDGIINPYGGDNTTYSGAIRSASGSQIGKVQNYAMPTATSKILLGWQTSCTISRMKLSKITADTFIGTMATQDYVDTNYTTLQGTLEARDGLVSTFYQTTAPTTGMEYGDYWLDTDSASYIVYRYQDSNGLNNGTLSWAVSTSTIATTIQTGYKAQSTANTAVVNAAAAQTTANTASTNANSALAQLTDITSDNVLSSNEKPVVIADYTNIINEQSGIDAQATSYGITTEKTAYDNAVTALTTYLNGLTSPVAWNILTGNTTIVGTTFRTNFSNVYSTRQTLLNAITAKAKTLADTAQSSANTANTLASTKIKTFYQSSVPTSSTAGDIWIDTDDGNKMYIANAANVNSIVTSGNGWYNKTLVVPAPDFTSNNDLFAQAQGFANFAEMEASYSLLGSTIINGGYLNTDLIQTNAIVANQINTVGLIAENFTGTEITGKVIRGAYIEGAVIKASYLDLDGELEVLTNYHLWTSQTQMNNGIAAGQTGKLYTNSSEMPAAIYLPSSNEWRIPSISSIYIPPLTRSWVPTGPTCTYYTSYTSMATNDTLYQNANLYAFNNYTNLSANKFVKARPTFVCSEALLVGESSNSYNTYVSQYRIYFCGVDLGVVTLSVSQTAQSVTFNGVTGTNFTSKGISFKATTAFYYASGMFPASGSASFYVANATNTLTEDALDNGGFKIVFLYRNYNCMMPPAAVTFPSITVNNMI